MRPVPRDGTFAQFVTYYKSSIEVDDVTGCWNWKAGCNDRGYARVSTGKGNSKNRMGHALRVFYEVKHGPIAEGFEPHHTCRNRKCVNPEHAEIVTHQKNCELDALERVPNPLYEKTRRKRCTQ